jgi:hypothetical protein
VNEVIQAAAELQDICQSQGWQFCFIGGVALQRWSEPRKTVDVDLSLFAGFGDEQQFCDVLLKHFAARVSDAAAFARERRVLLPRSTKGIGLDVERIIVRQTGKLDWNYIREQLQPLAELKKAAEILDQPEARRVEFER